MTRSSIYEHFKGTKYGMRKKDTLAIIREKRKIPAPSKEIKERAIPIRYRKPIVKIPAIPLDKYRIATLIHKRTRERYYIRFDSKSSFEKQFRKIGISYGYDKKDFVVTYSKPKEYAKYIDPEFKRQIRGIYAT